MPPLPTRLRPMSHAAGPMRFIDRRDAGRSLAELLRGSYAGRGDVLVLALPRGGVPVALEVAAKLGAPMDVFLVRRLPAPGEPELAMGAVSSGGVRVLNDDVIRRLGIRPDAIEAETDLQRRLLADSEEALGVSSDGALHIEGRTILLVDDGLCTGATARAASMAIRALRPARVVVAVPVASRSGASEMLPAADEIVSVIQPEPFRSVGWWYDDFSQTADAEVRDLLARARAEPLVASEKADASDPGEDDGRPVLIPAGGAALQGALRVPTSPAGLVLFAHGSGSGRGSARNRRVARELTSAGFATLLMDLLTPAEQERDEVTREHRFDVRLLADRLVHAIDWIAAHDELSILPLGLFGASTGGSAALAAAALRRARVRAVVSRGGRSDLAEVALPLLFAPTLFIVGEWDETVMSHNERARSLVAAITRLAVVPGATHLFGEAGAIEAVARLACDWYAEHLTPARHPA